MMNSFDQCLQELRDYQRVEESRYHYRTMEHDGTSAAPTADVARLGDILDEVETLIARYVFLPAEGVAALIAAWVAGTYLYEAFQCYGYLSLRSATPRCGKSRLLKLVSMLAKGSPPVTSTPTAAVLFRSSSPVRILDEVDRLRNQDKEMFGDVMSVLNTGFEKGGTVERLRRIRDGWHPEMFSTYKPTALAGIESLVDTLADRCFSIRMARTPQRMPRMNVRRLRDHTTDLQSRMEQWAISHTGEAEKAYTELPTELRSLEAFDDRFQDISEPLIVIAALADGERPSGPAVVPRVLRGLYAAAHQREAGSREQQITAFLELAGGLLEGAEERFVSSQELVSLFAEIEDLSSIDTPRKLKSFLKHIDVFPYSTGTKRGYKVRREWVVDWRSRYPQDEGTDEA